MASDLENKKVAEIVRETIAKQLKATGETTSGAIATIVCTEHHDIVAPYAAGLLWSAISKMASGQLRSWFAVSLAGETQLLLPGIPGDVLSELPPTLTVPTEDGELRHVLLSRVTLGQFRAYERMLAEQIKADQRRHRAVRFIVMKAKGLADDLTLQAAFGATQDARP